MTTEATTGHPEEMTETGLGIPTEMDEEEAIGDQSGPWTARHR